MIMRLTPIHNPSRHKGFLELIKPFFLPFYVFVCLVYYMCETGWGFKADTRLTDRREWLRHTTVLSAKYHSSKLYYNSVYIVPWLCSRHLSIKINFLWNSCGRLSVEINLNNMLFFFSFSTNTCVELTIIVPIVLPWYIFSLSLIFYLFKV